jgi:hypothetical protein
MATKITLAAIDTNIAQYRTNRAALQSLAHTTAMMIVRHAAPKEAGDDCNGSGDCTRALPLAVALPKSEEAQLKKWLHDFTPIRYNISGGNVGYDKAYTNLSKAEKLTWWKIEEAAQTPFFDYSVEPEVRAFDFIAMKKMIERMPAMIDKKMSEGLIPEEDRATALALKERLEAFTVTRVKAKTTTEAPANTDTPASVPAVEVAAA